MTTGDAHALPPPETSRQAVHRRGISLQAYHRDDGLYDLEAVLEDVKPHSFESSGRQFMAGEPIHLMGLRLTIDEGYVIVKAAATIMRTPFQDVCPSAAPRMDRLVGCHLLKGFSRAVDERLGPADRCTHLVAMAKMLPTLAVQTLMQKPAQPHQRPLKIDGCHAWRSDGALVKEHLPQWYLAGGEVTNPFDH